MESQVSTYKTKKGLAQMLKGGVIMDVVTSEHAMIAEGAGAVAVMALERVPADIRADGGVARMSDPELISEIMESVSKIRSLKGVLETITNLVADFDLDVHGAPL